jgi:tryptophanyl-tRNA synthetase
MVAQLDQMEMQRDGASAPDRRLRVFSGIQPSGISHIGNYLGAIRNWVHQQEQYDSIFCVVDLHALTLPTNRDDLRAQIRGMANVLLACGIDPAKSVLFVQSDVREHSELTWLLSSVTQFGELQRMTQFKDKSVGKGLNVSAALFTYPILMAADIILYDADLVPVGDDQKQHIEITRDIATRFNARYGETFVVPEPDIKPEGARIMSLDDPSKKMSKSDPNPSSFVALTDDADTIRRKMRRAVTDSGSEVRAAPDKPALSNLLTIYSLFSGESIPEIEERYSGKGYGAFKGDLAEIVVAAIAPIQERLVELEADPSIAAKVLAAGADRAREFAVPKMELARDRVGIGSASSGA